MGEVQGWCMLLLELMLRLSRTAMWWGWVAVLGVSAWLQRHLCTDCLNAWAHVPSISGIPCLIEIDSQGIYMCTNSHNPN